jgi:hypothetical protein
VTTGTVEEMHREVLPHPNYSPDLAPGDFPLFGPLKEDPGKEKRLTAKDGDGVQKCRENTYRNIYYFKKCD